MTLRDLKPLEKNGNGRYEPRPGGIVLSLGGAIAAMALSGNALLSIGRDQSTLDWLTDRVSVTITQQRNLQADVIRLKIDIAELKTMLNERTAMHDSDFAQQEQPHDSL